MRYQDLYQFSLIFFAFVVVFGSAVFVYHELFPEYKIYQYAYKDLEKFRTSYTGEKPAPFSVGIKQILIPSETGGLETIDRCTSCHVAMDLTHFSPTRVALDVNDQPMIDASGNPILEPNPDYVWTHLEQKIEQLRSQGNNGELGERLAMAEQLADLKTMKVEGKEVDVEKVIQMHPLIGAETRPFQYHPMSEYGCTSCHSGNGRALVAKRAHGPVYDGEYETAAEPPKPQFTEIDLENDPRFARMYNNKPGHELIFQTTPILAGPLLVANCVQCHQPTSAEVTAAVNKINLFTNQKSQQVEMIQKGLERDRSAIASLYSLQNSLKERGYQGTIDWLNEELGNYRLPPSEIDALEGQLAYMRENKEEINTVIEQDIENHRDSIVVKERAIEEQKEVLQRFKYAQEPLTLTTQNKALVQKMQTDVDHLISNYERGKELYISQACYACHRIAGFSRSSVGPELTKAGYSYPWYIKESIVWPQADLPSSTMPNFRLDHEELSDLMAFLMAQKGETQAISEVDYQIAINEWEKGTKMPWEEPVVPTDIKNVREGMLVFASEGCAACHKLQGFESNVGFAIDVDSQATALEKIDEREWFYRLFPEQILGSNLAKIVEEHAEEIDKRIISGIHSEGVIEEIEVKFPGLVEGFYSNFKFASRAYNTEYENDLKKLADYKARLHRVLMVYIQEYGLGRDIAPHLNWSGVYRDNAWLLGHFHNPSAYTAKSIMPVMPFDDTKFYMLNHMLHVLGRKNRDSIREIWKVQGFNPPLAFELLCSACHGAQRQGNGIISEWIYPIPKNLRNPVFLRSLTKERAIDSITHGVKGTPMPPWGEAVSPTELGDRIPVLTHFEIVQLVDWLYQGLPSQPRQEFPEDYEKWRYTPSDVVEEMEKSDDFLQPIPPKGEDVQELVHTYFEQRPNPIPGPDKELYYIRERYYTDHNLEEAKQYFTINCASCHGKEGTGTGLRATSMVEAKPRMFTNLPWIRTRDDLRLLRSIKYGVPGTAMTPFGDQTSSTQRMQLVMFIRQLTRSALLRDDLEDVLYEAFDRTQLLVEEARIQEYSILEKNQEKLRQDNETLYLLTEEEKASAEEAAKVYGEVHNLKKSVKKGEKKDKLYRDLISLLKEERTIYETLGAQAIAANLPETAVEQYFSIIQNHPYVFTLEEGKLKLSIEEKRVEKEMFFLNTLLATLDQKIAEYQKKIDLQESKIRSPDRGRAIQELMDEQGTYINLKTKLSVQLAHAKTLRKKQKEIWEKLKNGTTSVSLLR